MINLNKSWKIQKILNKMIKWNFIFKLFGFCYIYIYLYLFLNINRTMFIEYKKFVCFYLYR